MNEPENHRQGVWHRLSPTSRRIVRAFLTLIATGALALGWGVFSASYTGAVGPHVAHYSTTLNSEVTFDMGPLGSLILDSPLPFGLGVDVHVGQIPDELNVDGKTITPGPDQAVAALTADLASYTQFFVNPGESIEVAARGVIMDAVSRTVLMWSLLLTAVLLGRLAAHGVLRAAVASAWRQPGVPVVAAALVIAVIAIPVIPATQGSAGVGSGSKVFEGTALEDARITGRLGALLDHYGPVVMDEIKGNEQFYDNVANNVIDAFNQDTDVKQPSGPLEEMPAVEPPQPPAHPDRERREVDPVTMVVVSDLHCNVGMGKVAGLVAHQVEADVILNLGDNVLGGTAVEQVCIDSFASSFGGIPVVAANGNHDSHTTSEQQREQGWHVLDGEVIEVAGIRFLGDEDPTLTTLGEPTRLVGQEGIDDVADRLTHSACQLQREGNPIDILAIHNPRATEAALDSGCVSYAFAGHFHRQIGPWQRGLGVQYLHTSTAGAVVGKSTIGPLNGPAGITIVQWDRANHEPRAMRVVGAMPDNSVELTPWYAWPQPPSEPVHHEWPTPQEAPWP